MRPSASGWIAMKSSLKCKPSSRATTAKTRALARFSRDSRDCLQFILIYMLQNCVMYYYVILVDVPESEWTMLPYAASLMASSIRDTVVSKRCFNASLSHITVRVR